MNIVFDLAGGVFNWQPLALLQATLARHARNEAEARELAEAIFQQFAADGDWGAFDRGEVDAPALAAHARSAGARSTSATPATARPR